MMNEGGAKTKNLELGGEPPPPHHTHTHTQREQYRLKLIMTGNCGIQFPEYSHDREVGPYSISGKAYIAH